MATFHFPLLFWVPGSTEEVNRSPFTLIPRCWDVSIFDLYSLVAEAHPIRIPAEMMQVFLPNVNLEIAIDGEDYQTACRLLDTLRAILYSQGLAPTIAPFATSHSLNAYAGINSRSSDILRDKLPKDMREGITAKDTKIEGWPNELSLMCLRGDPQVLTNELDQAAFIAAADAACIWQGIEDTHPSAGILRAALAKAPLMPDLSSSILHMWQALENLFGIDREVTYRTSLMLAEMCSPVESRASTYRIAKKSYGDRSKIAHGSTSRVDTTQWMRAWSLMQNSVQAVLDRGTIPSASELTDELLAR